MGSSLSVLLGLALAIALGWLTIRLGVYVRERFGIGFSRAGSIAIGVAIALVLWFLLRRFTGLPEDFVNALGIGPAVGLSEGLRRPAKPKKTEPGK